MRWASAAWPGRSAVAAEVMSLRFGPLGREGDQPAGGVSCLGAINGMLFTGARVYYALGVHHPTFRWLGTWNERTGVPLRSLVVQTLVTLGLVIGFGLYPRGLRAAGRLHRAVLLGLHRAGRRRPDRLAQRGACAASTYRVPLFPLTPLLFVRDQRRDGLCGRRLCHRQPLA